MRAVIATVTFFALAAPASGQVCVGGPAQPSTITVGGTAGYSFDAEATDFGAELVAWGDQGVHFTAGAAWSESIGDTQPWTARTQIAYAPATSGIQVCPVLELESTHVEATTIMALAAGLGAGTFINPTVGLFARADLSRAWIEQIPSDWAGLATLGATFYLPGVDVTAAARANVEHVNETVGLRIAVRALTP